MKVRMVKFSCGCIGIPFEPFNSGGRCKALVFESCSGDNSMEIRGVYYDQEEPLEMTEEGLELFLSDIRKKLQAHDTLKELQRLFQELPNN